MPNGHDGVSSAGEEETMLASANNIAVVALILGLATAIARAGGPPKLDMSGSGFEV